MAGSSATVNRKAGKYIITLGLSLPEGFAVSYGIQRKQAGGKRGGQGAAREGKKKQGFVCLLVCEADQNGEDVGSRGVPLECKTSYYLHLKGDEDSHLLLFFSCRYGNGKDTGCQPHPGFS